jgi:hypothetical protein
MKTVNRRGKILRRLLVVVVALGVLIALLPWLASRMVVPGLIEDAISQQIDGTATIEKVSLNWFGEQRITGLTIIDAAGVEQAKIDGVLKASIVSLMAGPEALTVSVGGHANATVNDRGQITVPGVRDAVDAPEPKDQTDEPAQSIDLAGVPPLSVQVNTFDLIVHDLVRDALATYTINDGSAAYRPGGACNIDMAGTVAEGDRAGTFSIKGAVNGLFDQAGTMQPKGADASMRIAFVEFALLGTAQPIIVRAAEITFESDDLAGMSTIDATVQADLGDAQTSELVADLNINSFLRNTGQVNSNPADIVGTVRGERVPSALLQFAFADTPVVLSRELGDVLDMDADLNRGQPGRIVASLNAEHASAQIDAVVDPHTRRIVSGSGEVTGRISPQLVSAVSDFGIDRPGQFTLTITDLRDLRTASSDDKEVEPDAPFFDPAQVSLEGSLQLHNAIGLRGETHGKNSDGDAMHDLGTIDALDLALTLHPGQFGPALSGSGTLQATIVPDEFERRTGIAVDRATMAQLDVRSLEIPILRDDPKDQLLRDSLGEAIELPLLGETWLVMLPSIGVQATARVPGPIRLTGARNPDAPIEVQGAVANIHSEALGGSVHWTGGAQLGSGVLRFDEQLTHLFDDQGQLNPREVRAVGFTEITGVPGSLLAAFVPREHAELSELLHGDVSFNLATTSENDVQRAALTAEGDRVTLNAGITRTVSELLVERLDGEVTATPAMSAWLERMLDQDVQLRSDTQITFKTHPFTLVAGADGAWSPRDALQVRITMADSTFGALGPVREDWQVRNLDLEVTARGGDAAASSLSVQGLASIHRPLTDVDIADLAFDVVVVPGGADQPARVNGTVNARNVLVRHVESIIGKPRGTLSYWLGVEGDMDVALDATKASQTVNIDSRMPLLKGRYIASLHANGMVDVQATNAQVVVSRHTFNQLVSPAEPVESGATPAPPKLRLVEDAPFALAVESCRFPLALLTGDDAFDPQDVNVAVSLTGGRLRMVNENRSPALLDEVTVSLNSRDLRNGIGFDVSANAGPTVDEASGPVRITGTISNVLGEADAMTFADAQLQLHATATDLPTAALDGLMDLNSLLLAAVGPSIRLEATANEFSREHGSLNLDIQSQNGSLNAAFVSRDGHLRTTQQPVRSELELTEPFRQELLQKIHPILADIRSAEHPLRVQVSNVALPFDGRVNSLNADIAIEIGAVQLDAGSSVLKVLRLFNQTEHSTIDGRFDPIAAKIRNGVLTYDRFSVQLDRYSLAYAGTIDLNARTIDLRTEIPLAGLAMSVKELRGYADDIVVPIVTRGTFDAHETIMDPEFDLFGAAVEAGFRGSLNDLLKDEGIPLGDIFGDLFKQIGQKREN